LSHDVSDDGTGLPVGDDLDRSLSLGLTFMHGFSAQLGGELRITSTRGLTISTVLHDEQLSLAQPNVHFAG
jgi:two-component sensor histidine kinase